MNSSAPALALSGLSAQEIERATSLIEQNRTAVIGLARLLNPTQWTWQPAPGRWSAAEIVEHIVAVQERVMARLNDGLAGAPPPPAGQDAATVDNLVVFQFPDRSYKFPSPIPMEIRFDKAGVLAKLEENCAALAAMLTSTPGLREHALEAPPLKAISKGAYSMMDGYQWILAVAGHTERHVKQILEVIGSPGFPC